MKMELPVLFVSDGVVYPHAQIKLPIRSKSNFFMIESCLMGKSAFTMVAIVYGTDLPESEQKFFNICTIASVEKVVCWSTNNTATQYTLHVRGIARGEIVKHGVPLIEINQLLDPDVPLPEPSVISDFLAHLMVLLSFAPANSTRDNLRLALQRVLANKDRDINKIVYLTMALLRMVSYHDQLKFLAENDGFKRMEIALQYAKEAIKAYGSVSPKDELDGSAALLPMNMLQNKRPPVKKRLNELEQLEQDLQGCELPEGTVKDNVMDDFQRLKSLPNGSHDYQVLYGYLKLVAALPWNKTTEDSCDLEKSRKILDADHEGMADVKKRVLEFLAVKQMKKDIKGPILCLVGPPGVGKTSIAKAIADTLNRKFERIALGGVHDQSSIRGHRRTYVGAMPGRIIQAVKQAKTRNPVILLDEVDKMGSGPQGDPAAALLEVLDPAQNHTFQDQYLNLPFDISQVLFVATANDSSTIPGPLLDRMELIEMSGYTMSQKVEIAKKYIIPRQLAYHALTPDYLEVKPEALERIVSRYTREAGVRQLERTVAAICRWAALKVAEVLNGGAVELDTVSNKLNLPIVVKAETLQEILGKERFTRSRALLKHASRNVGVALGLAWTPFGGEVLVIETVLSAGTGKVNLTGKLGDIIRESVQVALSLLRSKAGEYALDFGQLKNSDLHVHMPAGAVSKDGPSAGCAFTLALFSLLSGRKVRSDSACTGEISLTGKVLPVGGVKEKVLAAHRAGIMRVSLPVENKRDVADLDPSVVEKMNIFFVDNADQLIAKMIQNDETDAAKL